MRTTALSSFNRGAGQHGAAFEIGVTPPTSSFHVTEGRSFQATIDDPLYFLPLWASYQAGALKLPMGLFSSIHH